MHIEKKNVDGIAATLVTNSIHHNGKCISTGCYYNKLVLASIRTGAGVKSLPVDFIIYKLAFILFVMTPGAQTVSNIAVYGSATQLLI